MANNEMEKQDLNPENEQKTNDPVIHDDNSPMENEEAQDSKAKKQSGRHKKDKDAEVIKEFEIKLAELTDKHLRLQAEFDNYRKRTLRERAELIRTAGESVLVNILPVIDNFERALTIMKDIADDDPSKMGMILIYNQFRDFLKQNNLKEIEAVNQNFDVDHHEAITKFPAPTEELKGKVVDVIQKGYMLNDKVIRFAKVVVGE
jgi:molecular chaperone GrpE